METNIPSKLNIQLEVTDEMDSSNLSLTNIYLSTALMKDQINRIETVATGEIKDLISQILIRDDKLKKAEQRHQADKKTMWRLQCQLNTAKENISKLEQEKKNMQAKHDNELKEKTEELSTYHREYSDFVAKLKNISEFPETLNSSGKEILAHVEILVTTNKRNRAILDTIGNCMGTTGHETSGNLEAVITKNLTNNTPSTTKSISKSTEVLTKEKLKPLPSKHNIKKRNAISRNKFQCSLCPSSFPTFGRLKRHVGSCHPDYLGVLSKYTVGCSLCGAMFETMKDLRLHRTTSHKPQGINGSSVTQACSIETGQQIIKSEISEDDNSNDTVIIGHGIDSYTSTEQNVPIVFPKNLFVEKISVYKN